MSTRVPSLLAGLFDDAAMLPPWAGVLHDAVGVYQRHRAAPHGELLGSLLVPASRAAELLDLSDVSATRGTQRDQEHVRAEIGIVGDTGPAPHGLLSVCSAIASIGRGLMVRHAEVAVAMRGEDPLPGLRALLDHEYMVRDDRAPIAWYAEVPLTWGVMASLDLLAIARRSGAAVGPKFRIGGLAAELFPTPVELAAVICACRDRDLPFNLTAGRCRAIRRTDPETGLVNHGFLNVLAAVLVARANGEAVELAEVLATTDAPNLVEIVGSELGSSRPLVRGVSGYRGLDEPLGDLHTLGLLPPELFATE